MSWYGYLTGTPPDRPEWELYDLTADPTEQDNVYSERAADVGPLQAALLAWERSNDASPAP